jgi:hypothetical protein
VQAKVEGFMNLSDVFTAVAHKELVSVDLPDRGSNQHETNGNLALKEFFGGAKIEQEGISWHYFADDQEPAQEDNKITFYDARAKSADRTGRSEWRLYYYGDFLSRAEVGDLLVLARTPHGRYFGLVFQRESAWQRASKELFGLRDLQASFDAIPRRTLDGQQFELLRQQIVAELDLDLVLPVAPSDEELMLKKFGRAFPSTRDMSSFARTQVETDFRRADETLARWLEREEQLFRALENVIIRERLALNFATVDEFIQYSLSVQNRRKSRMGFALQNHLAELFTRLGLQFTPQAKTEANNKPDFIFPGEREYRDAMFNSTLLVMLGVKSTSKDRWRQVLTEADRIPQKHLCTLEAGISTKQTDEMRRQSLTLVVPAGLHVTDTTAQRTGLLSVAEFVEVVRGKSMCIRG